MSFIKIWVHIVWGTKNREQLLTSKIRTVLYQHVYENAREKGIIIDTMNGFTEHVHCLVKLQAEQSIAKIGQLLKGESAYWANKNNLTPKKLIWADEYFAVSVSESMVNTVRTYINKQEEHHQKISFDKEYHEFISKYAFPTEG